MKPFHFKRLILLALFTVLGGLAGTAHAEPIPILLDLVPEHHPDGSYIFSNPSDNYYLYEIQLNWSGDLEMVHWSIPEEWEGWGGSRFADFFLWDPDMYILPQAPVLGSFTFIFESSSTQPDLHFTGVFHDLSAVPEPSSLLLLGSGVVGLAWLIRRKN